ncbi:MAG: family ATPase [Candidatus Brocadiaceae bacterium]|nr:family ATPase [Candidatus Brocadiaceae bacterium]
MPLADKRPLEYIMLEGYKSIKKLPKFRLNHDLNVLIGANGSGKTNFVRFFELLGHIMDKNKGLQNYLSANGRADAFLFRGVKVTEILRAHLWFGLNEFTFMLRAAADRSMFFVQESAPSNGPFYGIIENDQGSGHTESSLSRKTRPSASEKRVVDTISDWVVYHFHDTSPNARVMGVCNTIDNQKMLGDAANISAFLMRLQNEKREHYERIVKTVRLAAPFFGDFVLKEVASGQTQLLWRERYGDQLFYPHQLSDGSLRFVCLATLLLQPSPPSTVIIDEPELGLHPYAIEVLAGMLREASSRCQVIVSTQSKQLVDEFEAEDLIVVDRKDGETTFNRLSSEELELWLNDYSLGELWGKNVLGGRPQP